MTAARAFVQELQSRKRLIGMIHLGALPGAPANAMRVAEIAERAVSEAKIYRDCGIDIVMIENMHDVPYTHGVGPEVTAVMAVVGRRVKELGLTCGIQILAAANREALACALAAEMDFIRVEGFVYAHVADEGLIESCAGDLLRYRKQIRAEHIPIFADIKKKHASHAITADVDIAEAAETAEFFGADGVIVTGRATGKAALVDDVTAVRGTVDIPVLIGSGITAENIGEYMPCADGFIVGSYVKEQGAWDLPVSVERVQRLVAAFRNH